MADELGRFFSKIVGITSEGQEQSYSGNDPGLNGGCKVQFQACVSVTSSGEGF